MTKLNIATYIECTVAEGPGKRFAIWTQGCLKRCVGCCNPHMQPLKPTNIISVDYLMQLITYTVKNNNIEGITIQGGEPFLQARGLSDIAERCRDLGLSVFVFSGYTLTELENKNDQYVNKFIDNIDVLIDGEYIFEETDDNRNWIGSTNQNIHFLSGFYKKDVFSNELLNEIDISIFKDKVIVNGKPFLTINKP